MNDDDFTGESRIKAGFRESLGKLGTDKIQQLLNVLLESPFFYRNDDVDLFGLLRRRQALIAEFFAVYFGWELYVDQQMARLIKPSTHNRQLSPSQRHVFHVGGREEYILFVLLLEFHQIQADEQNIDLERDAEVRFVLADFVEFCFQRYREVLGDAMPSESTLWDAVRRLFRKLQRHRFIALRERSQSAADSGLSASFSQDGASSALFALLPGLRCYRTEPLDRLDLFGSTDSAPKFGNEQLENDQTPDWDESAGAIDEPSLEADREEES